MTSTEIIENERKRDQLWFKVLVGLLLGFAIGSLVGPDLNFIDHTNAEARDVVLTLGQWIALPGNIFLIMLRFIVIPLVISSVMLGIADGNDTSAIGMLGAGIIYFVITTTIAITIAFFVTSIIQPGAAMGAMTEGLVVPDIMQADIAGRSVPEMIRDAMPTNIIRHMADNAMLQLVIAAAIFGVAMLKMDKEESLPILDLMRSTQKVCMTIVMWLMQYAPIVVFGLIANTVLMNGFAAIESVALFFVNVIIILLAMLGVYAILLKFVARRSPLEFFKKSREVMVLAFSTSSSSATMPVTLEVAIDEHKMNKSVVGLVIPLGTTINMDGTALYQAAAAIFIAQAYGIDLTTLQMVSIVVLTIAGSIGTPGIPSAGIPILAGILASQGIPVEGIALIMGVDRLLDMSRTVVNVMGDLTAAAVLEKLIGKRFDKAAGKSKT